MIKRIIFDLDDTLIPWTNNYFYKFIPVMKEFEVIDSKEDILKFSYAIDKYEDEYTYYNDDLFIEYINRKLDKKIPIEFYNKLRTFFTTCIPEEIDMQIVDTLDYLSDKYELVVLTNFFEEEQQKRLENYGIKKYFKHIYGGNKFIKPAKESYLLACGEHNPGECLMIGDNYKNDVEGALVNGLQVIYLNNKKENVTNDIICINNLIELKNIL